MYVVVVVKNSYSSTPTGAEIIGSSVAMVFHGEDQASTADRAYRFAAEQNALTNWAECHVHEVDEGSVEEVAPGDIEPVAWEAMPLKAFEVSRWNSLYGDAQATVFARTSDEARMLASSMGLRVGGYPSTSSDWDTREVENPT